MGGRFRSLNQTSVKIMSYRLRNWMKTKKKVFAENWSVFSSNFTAIGDFIRLEFVGFIRAGWLLIVLSSSAQISMGGSRNLGRGTLNLHGETRLSYNLRTVLHVTEKCVLRWYGYTRVVNEPTSSGPNPARIRKLI